MRKKGKMVERGWGRKTLCRTAQKITRVWKVKTRKGRMRKGREVSIGFGGE